ncbi:type VI secretion system baseplate subunit TssE [Massilia sp. ZL223]|uniref:type VI secretion system baseplate subunit TssE n=1 Tax=Massilia sp. ZL223 TaxID=2824904 RepID=UPI001B8274E9|nr:type VI secretion system baseplate subunit TssE [Massilia sp. ZL223]MBQ5963911.1 type VI secretion system baseplate subunit TssE [Massilia sp. ZL223]
MADLAPCERLQPSLLDRLTDDEPDSESESRERRVLSLRALRNCVLRDLAWLFNTTCLLLAADAPRLPHVASSVLNYGLPDLSGNSIANLNLSRLERAIRQAIWDFEPRLIRSTVSVRALPADSAGHNKISFEIEADMWAQPYPERLYLRTELDLEHGSVTLAETGARSLA